MACPPASTTGPQRSSVHQPLSQDLHDILATEPPPGGLTLNLLFLWTEGRGIYLFIVLLCLPFLAPSIPGLSGPFGTVIMVLGARLTLGLPPRLPRFLGERPLPSRFSAVLKGSIRVLQFLEKWMVRPRRTSWMAWPVVRITNGLTLMLMAFYLALPLPMPLTNMLPAYAILLLALSMMEEDGVLIWVGYAVSAGALIYLLATADAAILFWQRWLHPVLHWLQQRL